MYTAVFYLKTINKEIAIYTVRIILFLGKAVDPSVSRPSLGCDMKSPKRMLTSRDGHESAVRASLSFGNTEAQHLLLGQVSTQRQLPKLLGPQVAYPCPKVPKQIGRLFQPLGSAGVPFQDPEATTRTVHRIQPQWHFLARSSSVLYGPITVHFHLYFTREVQLSLSLKRSMGGGLG